jgi:hypothetical protein
MELRILTWIFPWLMAIFELLLRVSLQDADATAFIGPTVGGASLGMLLPLTRAKELPRANSAAVRRISFDRWAGHLAQTTNIAIWAGFTAWACSLYLSLTHRNELPASLDGERTSILIGVIIWIAMIVFDSARGGKP